MGMGISSKSLGAAAQSPSSAAPHVGESELEKTLQILTLAGWKAEDWREALGEVDVPLYENTWRNLHACLRYRQ